MDVAAHDRAPRVFTEAAYAAAFLALMDSLACAFKALQDPECTKLLGALVPGATMAFGARIPGTSYQLDPVQAAFNIGTTVGWLEANDPALATTSGHLSDSLGAILAVADYRARKAIAEGTSPPEVRDLYAALLGAHEHASLEWTRLTHANGPVSATRATDPSASVSARCTLIRIASAASATSLLGGSRDQVAAAVAIARSEMPTIEYLGTEQGTDSHERWRVGDATSRGVRLALIALAGQAAPGSTAPQPNEDADLQGAVTAELDQTWLAAGAVPAIESRIRDRFAASVTAHFPAVQAGKIAAMFADQAKLEALSVNELVSMTVRN
jgi:2-methylcitrate dehydratase